MKKNRVFTVAVGSLFFLFSTLPIWSDSARQIEHNVDSALLRFRDEVKGAGKMLAEAKAVLVIPKVIKAGLFVGGEYGEGSLRIGGQTAAFYNVASASFGLTVGGEQKDLIVLFFSQEALEKFRKREGWEAGVDGNVAVVKTGTGKSLEATHINDPIVGFVVGVKGLMVDASFQGVKFTKIDR